MDTNKNSYTFIFASVMVIVVALLLSGAALGLKDRQANNVKQEKMQNILKTIGVDVTRAEAEVQYPNYIKQELVLDADGNKIEGQKAFDLNLATELKKPAAEQGHPLYIAENGGKKFYIVPLRGAGLWNAIWGYICLEEDFNTVSGVIFDHAGETPGLGADIAGPKFQAQFKGKKILKDGEVKSIIVQKGGAAVLPAAEQEYAVDAISGGTLTSDGVTYMLKDCLDYYKPYIEKNIK